MRHAAVLCLGSLGVWLFFFVLGNHALGLQLSGEVDVIGVMNAESGNAAIVAGLNALPLAAVAIGTMSYFTIVERLNSIETTLQLMEKDLEAANTFIDGVPKGDMVSPQVQELYMLVEYLALSKPEYLAPFTYSLMPILLIHR